MLLCSHKIPMKIINAALILFAFAAVSISQTEPDRPARTKSIPPPVYPEHIKQTGISGTVRVIVRVKEDGSVSSVERVIGPGRACAEEYKEPFRVMRESAQESAKKSVFHPQIKDGKPVSARMVIKYDFDPNRSKKANNSDAAAVKPPAGGGFSTINGGVVNGKAKSLPKPLYPSDARAAGAAGEVPVQILIDEEGRVLYATSISGHFLLYGASEDAACDSSFSPMKLNGKPVKVSGVVTYNYVP